MHANSTDNIHWVEHDMYFSNQAKLMKRERFVVEIRSLTVHNRAQ
jgi:hypothetical protein